MALKLFDYQSAGKGVSKNGPKKKPFFKFFEIFGRKFWKLIQLNLLFILFSLPLVTFGPAMAAMTHVMRQFVLEKPCFIFQEFFTAFKKNFKQSVCIGIFDVIAVVSITISLYGLLFSENLPEGYFALLCVVIGFGAVLLMMHFYIYLEIVALNLNIRAILKNALLLVFLGVKRNFIALIINLAIVTLIALFLPFSIFVVVFFPLAWMCFATVFICYPVIQKYIVNPYYEERGERNPELMYEDDENEEEAVFVDRGGQEEEIHSVTKAKGKVIR